jgi:hypothetical protein
MKGQCEAWDTNASFAAPHDDERADRAFRPWGSRRVAVSDARPGSAQPFHQPGVINPRSLRTISRLPHTALDVDSVYREPKRACGGWSFIRPFYQQYEYYREYGNAGAHALSSHHHNFPTGEVPIPARIYGGEVSQRNTKVVNSRPKRFNSVACMTTRGAGSPLFETGGLSRTSCSQSGCSQGR